MYCDSAAIKAWIVFFLISMAFSVGECRGASLFIGNDPNSQEFVQISGSRVYEDISVGILGDGTLHLIDSSTVAATGIEGLGVIGIGLLANSVGAIHAFDHANLHSTGRIVVADQGEGLLEINDYAEVEAAIVLVGFSSDSLGEINVNGFGELSTSDDFELGIGGRGELNIEQNAIVTIGDDLGVGRNDPNGSGDVFVSGVNALLNVNDFFTIGVDQFVPLMSSSRLTVENGGLAAAGDTLRIRQSGELSLPGTTGATSNGGVIITPELQLGGTADNEGGLLLIDSFGGSGFRGGDTGVGVTGTGTLRIENGGFLRTHNDFFIGRDSMSVGTVELGDLSGATTTPDGDLLLVEKVLRVGGAAGGQGTLMLGESSNIIAIETIVSSTGRVELPSQSAGGKFFTQSLTINGGEVINEAGFVVINDGFVADFIAGDLVVGMDGPGSLTVLNGGRFSSADDVEIGLNGGSVGTLTITSGGQVDVGNELRLGTNSTGNGTVNLSSGTLSTGTAASPSDPDLEIGFSGTGTFTQSGGTTTVADELILGHEVSGNGTLDLQGGIINANGPNTWGLYVGLRGEGDLSVSGTAQLNVARAISVGDVAGSDGTINVSSGGSITSASTLHIGNAGDGHLIVTGGQVKSTNASVIIANSASSTSDVTVSGTGMLQSGLDTIVGFAGDGSFSLSDSGNVQVGLDMKLGSDATGIGQLNIDGGQISVGDDFLVGREGVGHVDHSGGTIDVTNNMRVALFGNATASTYVLSGGQLNVGDELDLAHFAGSTAQMTVNAGTLTTGTNASPSDPDLEIGFSGTGTFTQSGGTTTVADELILGHEVSGNGTLDLQGGIINANGPNTWGLYVGLRGEGDLSVSGTAQLNVARAISVGHEAGSDGTINVSGGSITSGITTHVGENGNGHLNVLGGQFTTTSGSFVIADKASSTSDVTVSGTGTLHSGVSLWVANGGNGTLTVENGGAVSAATQMHIGNNSGSDGTLTVNSGGTVTVGAEVTVGDDAGSNGTINVNGGTLNANDSFYVGGLETAAGGTGTLAVNSGDMNVTSTLKIWSGGTVDLNGGTLKATTIEDTNGGTFNYTGGELNVDLIEGDLQQQGGKFVLGASDVSTSIYGNYIMNSGTLAIEIGGLLAGLEFDQLLVDGTAAIQGVLEISFINEYVPNLGDMFTILDAASLIGEFGGLAEGSTFLADGVEFDISYLGGGGSDVEILVTGFQDNADFDGDFDVDNDDLALWQSNFGVSAASPADADADGDSDGADFLAWQRDYTGSSAFAELSTLVPEPATALLFSSMMLLATCSRFKIEETGGVFFR